MVAIEIAKSGGIIMFLSGIIDPIVIMILGIVAIMLPSKSTLDLQETQT